MPPHLSELLQPSLSRHAPPRSPYSQQAHFFAAFFGGPMAAMGLNLVNSHRLGRLRRDAPWLLAGLAAALGLDPLLQLTGTGAALLLQLDELLNRRSIELLSRALSLALFALGLVMHRREHQATDLMGRPRPSGWAMGLGLICAGLVFNILWRDAMR